MRAKQVCLLAILAGAILQVITFLISTNYGADAIVRTYISLNWSAHPFFVWHPNDLTSVWPPLQFYIDGLALKVWNNDLIVPRLNSLLLSLISIVLVYQVSRRYWDATKAAACAACFSLYALHIKHGNIAGSESLFIFMLLVVILAYQWYQAEDGWGRLLVLGGSVLLASMVRFETWILPILLSLSIVIRQWRAPTRGRSRLLMHAGVFITVSSLFILLWMYGSYRFHGDPFYSLHSATLEHTLLTQENILHLGKWKTVAYNAFFWPGVLFISLSPLVVVAGLWGIVRSARTRIGFEWVIFAAVQMGSCLYHSTIVGDLAPLARYTILAGTIICLFAGDGLFELPGRLGKTGRRILSPQTVLLTALISLLLLSGRYYDCGNPILKKMSSISPLTHYPSSIEGMIAWLRENVRPQQKIMFNTFEYDATNAMILHSGIARDQCVPVNQFDLPQVALKLASEKPNLFVVHKTGPLQRYLGRNDLSASISLGNTSLQLQTRVGDFGVYIPVSSPRQ